MTGIGSGRREPTRRRQQLTPTMYDQTELAYYDRPAMWRNSRSNKRHDEVVT